jgi:protein-arginine kinase activator protein McsA
VKRCTECKKGKPLSEFHNNKAAKDGKSFYCKLCTKERNRAYDRNSREVFKRYGVSLEDYSSMLKQQQGVCAICGGNNNGKRLVVDHNHKTGSVRELLCNGCNTGIGGLKDSVAVLIKAARYLRKHREFADA